MSLTKIAATLLVFLASAMSAEAGFLIIGNNPDTELAVPFGYASDGTYASTRFQQVLAANSFTVPIYINSITFYAQGPGAGGLINAATYDLRLSTTSKAVGSLDGANFDANLGANTREFATTNLSGSAGATLTFGNPQGFLYNPNAGNLLLDLRIPNQVTNPNFSGALFDGQSNYGNVSSSASNFGPADPTSGLTVGISFNVVPEPSSLVLLATGTGLFAWSRRRKAVRTGEARGSTGRPRAGGPRAGRPTG